MGTYGYVKFCKSLYENQTFPITDKPVEFDANLKSGETVIEQNHMKFLTKMDTEQGKIDGEIHDVVTSGGSTSTMYIK